MKFNMKAVAASVLFAVAGTSQAAILNGNPYPSQFDGELFISIFRDTTSPESMIVDTGISLLALQAGTVTGWSSSASQTAAILGFLGTAPSSSFRFNAGGVTNAHDDTDNNNYFGFFTTVSATGNPDSFLGGEILTPNVNTSTFAGQINTVYSSNTSFNNDGILTGLNAGETGYHNINEWGAFIGGTLTFSNENVVGTSARVVNFLNTSTEFLGYELGYLDVGLLSIDAATGVASLSQDAAVVPIPAAAWLLGSGLVGLVGVARRRTA